MSTPTAPLPLGAVPAESSGEAAAGGALLAGDDGVDDADGAGDAVGLGLGAQAIVTSAIPAMTAPSGPRLNPAAARGPRPVG